MTSLWSSYGQKRPVITLFALFLAWKSLLALIVLTAPGIGYDTSTSLVSLLGNGSTQHVVSAVPTEMPSLWLKFIRWDAVYFTHMSEHGHIYEQEWAFGIGISTALRRVARALSAAGISIGPSSAVAGVLVSHICHWLSVVQLWSLTKALSAEQTDRSTSLAFHAAALHIISPAGVFLSAPCTEALFSVLSMSGFLSLVSAMRYLNPAKAFSGSASMMIAGLQFFAATIVRSNGILAGIPFLIEAMIAASGTVQNGFSVASVVQLAPTIAGGLLVGCGMVYPQVLAYKEYCYGREVGNRRPWCEQTIPSIFTWVQSHYWNVGPFRYWTLSNLPLFLLAAPSLWLLTYSAVVVLRSPHILSSGSKKSGSSSIPSLQIRMLASLALPQLVLAILALTSYHVQIITRLSSGYPLWYIWLASKLRDEPKYASTFVQWMVLYSLIQAGLYACFLPPA